MIIHKSYFRMSSRKMRLTVSVDRDLITWGRSAVKAGEAASLSAWVNDALAEHTAENRRRRAMDKLLADYQAEFGAFTAAELRASRDEIERRTIRPNARVSSRRRRRR